MIEEANALEAEAPEITPMEADQAQPQADAAPGWEDRALTMGWTPKSQFKGDPEKWVDAETFVKRGEEFLPFLKANNRRLEQAQERANTKIASLEKALQESIKHISKADARAYERARRDLETELEQATLAGDTEGVKAVTKEIVDLEKEVRAEEPGKHVSETPEGKSALSEFKAANPWFEKDRVMTVAAIEIGNELAAEGIVEPKVQLAEIAKRIRQEFPHKFTNPRREQPAAVEGAQPLANRTAARTYSDLPPEAKAMCDDFVKNIKGMTREKYVKDYFAEEKAK